MRGKYQLWGMMVILEDISRKICSGRVISRLLWIAHICIAIDENIDFGFKHSISIN